MKINEKGNLEIGGCDSVELINKYGSPLYVMDEDIIRKKCRTFKDAFIKFYNGKSLICYASKAFSCRSIYNIIQDEGLGIDVVSKGELFTALSVGFPKNRIIFHGNNKSYDELEYAIENGVHRIVVDNINELSLINEISNKKDKITNIILRITPGIEAHTHEFIRTGQIDSKFGFSIGEDIINAIKLALECKNICIKGIHSHIGSQIFDIEPFLLLTRVMLKFMLDVKNQFELEFSEINLGGGFAIKYTDDDVEISYEDYIYGISSIVKEFCKEHSLNLPLIMIEPGRAIVGEAGTTLYTVGNIKNIPNIRDYLSVDGGMSDNPRYILYSAKYDMTIANKAGMPKTNKYTVAGKCCENGDIIGKDIELQKSEIGDILAVFSTGAYNYSMSSNYNRIPRPAVIIAKNNNSRVIVKRETMEDIIRNDV